MNPIDAADQNFAAYDASIMGVDQGGDDLQEPLDQADIRLQQQETSPSNQLALRRKHNAALAVHTLPTEVFLQVIHLYILLHLEDLGAGYYLQIINLSRVCSRWYNVIRDSPPLWTRVRAADSLKLVETTLQRSSSHPLDIILHPTTYVDEVPASLQLFLDAVDTHRDRWRSLDILAPYTWMEGGILAALGEPAPSLEKLSVIDGDTMYCTRKVDLFGGNAPRLTSLTLNGVSIRWDSKVLHKLTLLDLSWIHFSSTDAILHALSHSTQLQILEVERCTTGSMATSSSPSVQLRQLVRLDVDLRNQAATENLLDHIECDAEDAPLYLRSRRKQRGGTPVANHINVDIKEGGPYLLR
ncbi:hypothetical protein M407DRAFT_27943 [Tulasnella calospora MUT 4182]|uniref:F-box domain-containing protein n=1 Tax=Tulasnella calospora MUT 4182 TaxID=1051891 RepID=A0A0C3KMF1_9AGAM|nr:hypothetical protein M407DRAFT_27943 [Tulasnella calospora MUT 4182]